jgi:hypothetical protein
MGKVVREGRQGRTWNKNTMKVKNSGVVVITSLELVGSRNVGLL